MTLPLQNERVDAYADENARQGRAEIDACGDRLQTPGQPSRQRFAGGTRDRPLGENRVASHARKSDSQIYSPHTPAPSILFEI